MVPCRCALTPALWKGLTVGSIPNSPKGPVSLESYVVLELQSLGFTT